MVRDRKLVVLLLLGAILAMQIHAWTDFDLCLMKDSPGHSGSNHNHRCQCEVTYLAMIGSTAGLSPSLAAAQLETKTRRLVFVRLGKEDRSPRAPPV